MKGRIRQRSHGSWQISYDLGRDALGKRKTKAVIALDQGDDPDLRNANI